MANPVADSMEGPPGRHPVAGALLDERSTPSLRERFGDLAARSKSLAVAIRRVRLTGVDLTADELRQVSSIRVLLGGLDAGTFVAEADAVMVDASRREGAERLLWLLQTGVASVRIAPLLTWAPDFSVFSNRAGPTHAIYGCHWFQRPPPSPGPAFALICSGSGAALGFRRFEELWRMGHDATPAVEGMLLAAQRRAGVVLGDLDSPLEPVRDD
ncbi:MAG: hypothetical protein HKN73_20020 [Gemmatimonadetes bacterium]|nr:hypothetical protein [Gemmatimonadota bacterium]